MLLDLRQQNLGRVRRPGQSVLSRPSLLQSDSVPVSEKCTRIMIENWFEKVTRTVSVLEKYRQSVDERFSPLHEQRETPSIREGDSEVLEQSHDDRILPPGWDRYRDWSIP